MLRLGWTCPIALALVATSSACTHHSNIGTQQSRTDASSGGSGGTSVPPVDGDGDDEVATVGSDPGAYDGSVQGGTDALGVSVQDMGSVDDGSADCLPGPLVALTRSCLPSGTCLFAASAASEGNNLCFANGVRAQTMPVTTSTGLSTTTSLASPDGNLCYSLETASVGFTPTAYQYTWRDPSGAIVATATAAASAPNLLTLRCDSNTYQVNTNSPACAGQLFGPPSTAACTAGTCAFPH